MNNPTNFNWQHFLLSEAIEQTHGPPGTFSVFSFRGVIADEFKVRPPSIQWCQDTLQSWRSVVEVGHGLWFYQPVYEPAAGRRGAICEDFASWRRNRDRGRS